VAARAVSSAGRAPALHAGGRRFESCTAHSTRHRARALAQPCGSAVSGCPETHRRRIRGPPRRAAPQRRAGGNPRRHLLPRGGRPHRRPAPPRLRAAAETSCSSSAACGHAAAGEDRGAGGVRLSRTRPPSHPRWDARVKRPEHARCNRATNGGKGLADLVTGGLRGPAAVQTSRK
jgi:hypothetical protein